MVLSGRQRQHQGEAKHTGGIDADTQILGMQIEVDTTPLRRDKTTEKGPDGGDITVVER